MKHTLRRCLVDAASLVFRCVDMVRRVCRVEGWARALREARWKAGLAALGEGTVIHPWVTIHNRDHVRIGARCSIAEFVHMWGGGGITIGNNVLIASHVIITSLTHDKNAACFSETLLRAPMTTQFGWILPHRVWPGYGRGKLSDSNRKVRHFSQRFKSRQDAVGFSAGSAVRSSSTALFGTNP